MKAGPTGPIFPPSRIKKIIQQNQEVGKLSNVVPHLVQKSLQLFLIDVLKKINQIAQINNIGKATPSILKKAIQQLPDYEFMKPFVQEIQDLQSLKKKKSQIKTEKAQKKISKCDDTVEGQPQMLVKRGRKRVSKEQKNYSNEQKHQKSDQ